MTYKSAVRSDGCLPLGEAAWRAGFTPGTLVSISRLITGNLLIVIDDEQPLDLPPLKGRTTRQPCALSGPQE